MIVGIMSDSHGDAAATARAVALLKSLGAEHYIHCGDVCGENVLAEMAGYAFTFVWGNCDDVSPAIRKYVEGLGLRWPQRDTRIELAGKRIAVYHGHEPGFATAAGGNGLDYLFYGHTHRYADTRCGGCRMINPGALYRARPRTCARLDLVSGALRVLRIDTGRAVPLEDTAMTPGV